MSEFSTPREQISNPEGAPLPYESIVLELSEGDVESAMELYLDFIQLPAHERNKIHYNDPEQPRTGMSGYEHKGTFSDNGQPHQDNKHVFHMSTDLERAFLGPAASNEAKRLPSESRLFIEAAQEIYRSLARSSKAKYQELQEDFPLLVGMHFPESGKLNHKLRFLAYQNSRDGMLARGHYDKGSGTIAVAESHGGLRIGFGEDDLTLLDRGSHDPVFFPGFGWHQLAQMTDVDTTKKAAWHDVIDTGESIDDDVMRWALIYFLDPANIYLNSTTKQTHTPIERQGARVAQSLHNIDFLAHQ